MIVLPLPPTLLELELTLELELELVEDFDPAGELEEAEDGTGRIVLEACAREVPKPMVDVLVSHPVIKSSPVKLMVAAKAMTFLKRSPEYYQGINKEYVCTCVEIDSYLLFRSC